MIHQSLCGSWQMIDETNTSYPAKVPGTVLTTLLEAGVIPDPFDGMNEYTVRERLRESFTFEKHFTADAALLSKKHLELVCEGLDTLAQLSLNGRVIADTDNMHRTWRFDVRSYIKEGENTLSIRFSSALNYVEQAARDNPEVTYGGGSSLRWTGALRKAHYMFGWDWGASLPDAGIWRNIYLEAYDARIDNIFVHQIHEKDQVTLQITCDTAAPVLQASLTAPDGTFLGETSNNSQNALSIQIKDPQLWWPNRLGDQPLYTLKLTACCEEGSLDERTIRIGLRTLTISRKKDEWGEEFAFLCNGERFFAMGADYIPQDHLLTRVTREKTDRLLQDCADANYNLVRVWGGGIYPGEDFFDLCDEKGLVVWLDLMYACNVYKLTEAFKENIIHETRDNLRRVRHHASLGLVCGNNEMETAWISWGGVMDLPEAMKRDYTEQFEHLLKEECEKEAPDHFYWPSSPSSGGGFDDPNSLDRGDVHDWSVWHGRRPFSDFTHRYPRFCSEFGFESFPCMDTLRTFIHDERDMNPFSRVMESHQKCESGNQTMLYYLAQTLRYPYSMEQLIHATQYLQGEAVRAGVEHWRRNRGRCMGAIYWQVNDCWPVASWASIDSFCRWKALHYMAKRFFAPVLVSVDRKENGCEVYIANEQRKAFEGKLTVKVYDLKGHEQSEQTIFVSCPALSSACVLTLNGVGENLPIVYALLQDMSGNTLSRNESLCTLPKYITFEKPVIHTEVCGNWITLRAETFCMAVELSCGDARFSDNWFTLYPGEAITVTADRPIKEDELTLRTLTNGEDFVQ